MNLHHVRRLAGTLVASQLRSGRSSSNPRSFFGQPQLFAVIDVGVFLGAFGLLEWGLSSGGLSSADAGTVSRTFLPFLPMLAIGVVLVAGIMFELTTTAKFAGSDAANWLPISSLEYLLASVSAIAYTYSPALALTLGALLPVAALGGATGLYVFSAVLSVVALFEGAILVEMVRAATQRAGSVAAGRRGHLNLVLRALVLIVAILLLQLAFNPVFLLGITQHLASVGIVTALVPFFWATQALTLAVEGNLGAAFGFAVAQILFVVALAYLAADVRQRYWVPAPEEVRLEAHRYAVRHRWLELLGLSPPESAMVSKDLKGLVRRREMLPTLVVPIVLAVLVLVEGAVLGGFVSVLWVGWVAGFFALLVSGSAVGEERKAIQSLYVFPVSPESVVRAKSAYVLVPTFLVSLGLTVVVGVFFGLSPIDVLLVLLLVLAASTVLTFWGLAFAARFSDFQERPRPQFLRPGGMLLATGTGMVLLFAILVPGATALFFPSSWSLALGAACLLLVLASGALAVYETVSGFRQLFRELPF